MKTLNYSSDVRTFRFSKVDQIFLGEEFKCFNYYFIHDYYPKNHFGNDVDDEILKVRNIVYSFKDGKTPIKTATLISDAIRSQGISLKNTCLVTIPASTTEKTEIRLRIFSNSLSGMLNITNGFMSITTKDHKSTKGTATGNKIEFFNFNDEFYKDKNVLLFDDVRTSGTTYKQVLAKLVNTGAKNIIGIFLAKTVSYLS